MKKQYFDGDEGVYFNDVTNGIVLLTNKSSKKFMNLKTFKERVIYTYDLQSKSDVFGSIVIKGVAITKPKNLTYLGDL